MRTLLIVITDLEIGGTPTVVRELATRLRDEHTRIEIVSLKSAGPVGAQLRSAGFVVHELLAQRMLQLPSICSSLRRLIRDRKADVVFSLLMHANVAAALATRTLPDVRLIQSIQTSQPNPRWHWLLQRFAARRARTVIVPSASAGRRATQWAHVDQSKLRVIPNAIDSQQLSDVSRNESDHFRVGFLGRLDPVKRVGDLVEACARLRGVWLEVFGDGVERARIAELISRSHANATMHGRVADPREALRRIDCLVLPSDAEGFGLVLIEAMAAGVPVIATDVDGIRDVVSHEANGLLVPPRNPAAIAHAIERIRTDESLRSTLIENGRRIVREQYAWPAVLAAYREVLFGQS